MTLQGKAAIVTGAAQGIGRAIAWNLAQEGASVQLADIQREKGEKEASAMRASGLRATFREVDVGVPDDIELMVAGAVDDFGRLDILVNNAAMLDIHGTAADTTAETWDRGFAVMVRALGLASGVASSHMRQVGGGSIINISSVHGMLTATEMAVYDTCKHAVIGLTRSAAVDFGPYGIRVNAICPGLIVTEVRDESWRQAEEEALFAEMYHPLRRVGRPSDIAAAVRYLVSDEAAFITGHALTVDGGLSIQLQDSLARRTAQHADASDAPAGLRTPPL